MVERRQKAEGRRFSPIVTLILYTNDATGHDINHYLLVFQQIYIGLHENNNYSNHRIRCENWG
ncbi:hypothetical protein, partial [Okeania sp. SIO3B5]|uniref:hypothetical protein n=1 Tax=Okeania sp. SIO3B5 TaxID=2607811 RepID=UPI0025F5644C